MSAAAVTVCRINAGASARLAGATFLKRWWRRWKNSSARSTRLGSIELSIWNLIRFSAISPAGLLRCNLLRG